MEKSGRIKKGIISLIVIILIFVLVATLFDFSQLANTEYITEKIQSFGMLGPVVFIALMALAIIVSPLPSLPLDIAGGAIWGPYLGTLFAVIGAEIGAIISFLIARFLGRMVIEKILHKNIVFCDNCNEKTLFILVFAARLFPFFQFDLISYGAGLTNMKVRNFAIATFFGMIPVTFLFAKFGESFSVGSWMSVALSVVIIILMFGVPYLINKHNPFGLRDKIRIE